jgi:hypothetical protein
MDRVDRWFSSGTPFTGLAVVLGRVSVPAKRGAKKATGPVLCCRDFDTQASYWQWAERHPHLAARLPTVQTARGFHVYFHGPEGFAALGDGELRSDSKHYCVLPPSRHPDGPTYSWLRPRPTGPRLPKINNPAARGLTPKGALKPLGGVTQEVIGSVGRDWEGVVRGSLPRGPGQRHRCVFALARGLRSLPQFVGAEPEALVGIVRCWWGLALPVVTTKDWETTWEDFRRAWAGVCCPVGTGPLFEGAWKKASASTPDGTTVERLEALCRELQSANGDRPFFLDCRRAGALLGVNRMTAWRAFGKLEKAGILVRVSTGTNWRGGGEANSYRYVGRGRTAQDHCSTRAASGC